MPKLFVLTLGKCQSKSYTAACKMLGLRSQQYPDDLNQAIKICDVVVGVELSNSFKRLSKQYPDAKFILLTREDEAWVNSFEKHCKNIAKASKQEKIERIRKKIFKSKNFERQTWLDKKAEFEKEVRDFFAQKTTIFLEINPFNLSSDEKWNGLINFLDPSLVEKKPDKEFPNID